MRCGCLHHCGVIQADMGCKTYEIKGAHIVYKNLVVGGVLRVLLPVVAVQIIYCGETFSVDFKDLVMGIRFISIDLN